MKHIVVISGKGGTGKTVMTASFAFLAQSSVIVDCDVDAANLHLLVSSSVIEEHDFKSGFSPLLNRVLCQRCGRCFEVCRFGAIREQNGTGFNGVPFFDSVACEGCRLCARVCPVGAIDMVENTVGKWFLSSSKYGPFYHARLKAAQENSGKLVACIKKEALKLAGMMKVEYFIVDGPPGIGCPVIASLSGAHTAIVVTEPTISGIHDVERVMDLAASFHIPVKVVINKYDLDLEKTDEIKKFCSHRGIELLGCVPFSPLVIEAVLKGEPIVACNEGEVAQSIASIWQKIRE